MWRGLMSKIYGVTAAPSVSPATNTSPMSGEMTVIFCSQCWEPYRSHGSLPERCPCCQKSTTWRTAAMMDDPRTAYELSGKDVALLHALKIDPETTP